jgi:outer membrane protein assembly factor BamB
MPIAGAWLLTLLSAASTQAEDWPQFRGPTGQGHSTETGLPSEWSESHNIAWNGSPERDRSHACIRYQSR